MGIGAILYTVFMIIFLGWYFSVKANRECAFAIMIMISPFVLFVGIAEIWRLI